MLVAPQRMEKPYQPAQPVTLWPETPCIASAIHCGFPRAGWAKMQHLCILAAVGHDERTKRQRNHHRG